MVESTARGDIVERNPRRMARRARRAERSFVHVGMARLAVRACCQERSRLVARCALERESGVPPVEREACDAGMIERPLIERAQFAVRSCMFDVAGHTIVPNVPVHPDPPRNAIRNRFVARQTFFRRNASPLLVAFLTVGDSLERRVRLRQRPRRKQCPQLCVRASLTHDPKEAAQYQRAPRCYHLKGT